LPAFRSRETRSLAKIWFIWRWNCGGELQWLEQARWLFCSGISFNKGPNRRLSVCRRLVAALLLLAGRGGRGEKHSGVGAFSNLCSLTGHGDEKGSGFAAASSSPARSATCRAG
jgi:hypothetical protein